MKVNEVPYESEGFFFVHTISPGAPSRIILNMIGSPIVNQSIMMMEPKTIRSGTTGMNLLRGERAKEFCTGTVVLGRKKK